ncbi:50S ribosomal protein L6 [Candidatus Woesearchaeota archaeon]|nr:MAG: 50S ribosomal protein L6 [Candidatus Woesearchaeota archaeon]
MREDQKVVVEMPEGVSVELNNGLFKFKGQKGEVEKKLANPNIISKVEQNKVVFEVKKGTKREKKLLGTFKAHVRNAVKGVTEGHVYKLKICSGHFPMNVSVSGDEFVVKNFLGEKIPRKVKISNGVSVKVNGQEVIVEGIDKQVVSQQAASIEQLCRITNRDRRIFQDGIFIIEKDGKQVR